MKKLLALSFAAVIISSAAFAQTERVVDNKPKTERHKGKHDKDKMMKELNLTKEQKVQLKATHKEMKAKREALKAQDNITVKEMREKQEALKAQKLHTLVYWINMATWCLLPQHSTEVMAARQW